MRWTWDDEKNRRNKRDHGISFETAQLVFEDPLHMSRLDPYPHEERWQTVGVISTIAVLVVHTAPQPVPDEEEEVGRIISARKATAH